MDIKKFTNLNTKLKLLVSQMMGRNNRHNLRAQNTPTETSIVPKSQFPATYAGFNLEVKVKGNAQKKLLAQLWATQHQYLPNELSR